ncbi:hypothetical protein SFRURICE_018428 [Spodoptera frugiperda]|uniref:SFRICE_017492 n=1 Tax=Spodoptera frugiperda TaxID=7108 RepID=A0A2H1X210_SPOFR|nr:hypothetical protein SFRURICE_018428 [Spodoptera frugiperda]
MKIIICVLILCTIALSSSEDTGAYYCGRRLVMKLTSLCYNQDLILSQLQNQQGDQQNDQLGQLRTRRSLVDDCCINKCDEKTILSYCY